MNYKKLNIILITLFAILVAMFVYKEMGSGQTKTGAVAQHKKEHLSKKDVEHIVKHYILNNPEDIIKSIEGLHKKINKEVASKLDDYLEENFDKILTANQPATLGNPEGDIKIALFFDYACSYCKKAYMIEKELLEWDKNIQIVLRPIPVLGEKSVYPTRAALAVYQAYPDLYAAFHHDLMLLSKPDKESIEEIFEKYKIDQKVINNEINSYSIQQLINTNLEFARNLGIRGTPYYIINKRIVQGMIPVEKFKEMISYLRSENQK